MSTTQYRLSWDSYKSNVCDGFTNLQQNEEFVDMTLAADGYMVKVHKNIFALASPYIKSMLKCTPTEHPVFFLSNISCDVLNYILTYVYTGEVSVDVDNIQAFMRVANELRLSGLSGLPIPKVGSKKNVTSNIHKQIYVDNTVPKPQIAVDERVTNNAILIDSDNATQPALTNIELLDTTVSAKQINITNVENVSTKHIQMECDAMHNEDMLDNRENGLYTTTDGYQYKLEVQQLQRIYPDSTPINNTSEIITSTNDNNVNFGSFEEEYKNKISSASMLPDSLEPKAFTPQYTQSTRGSFQLILNRFMYYCHHQSHGGRKRRWRCIEYRSKCCPAYIDTDGEIMTLRKFQHCHPFHDEKIRKKMKKDLIYTNLNLLMEKLNDQKKGKEVSD